MARGGWPLVFPFLHVEAQKGLELDISFPPWGLGSDNPSRLGPNQKKKVSPEGLSC